MALKAQITNTVIVGDLNTPLSLIDRSSRQQINKETSEVLQTLNQIDMVDIYRVFHLTTRQYTFFSAAHGSSSNIDHILAHKTSLNKFKKIKITPCTTSDHNGIKLDLNNKRNPRKYTKNMEIEQHTLKNQWVTKVIREEIKKFLELFLGNEMYNLAESVRHSKGHAKGKVYSYKYQH
jgi:hypothetical protein